MPLFLPAFTMNNKPLLSTLTGSNQKTKIELSELFEAYAGCRANKRNTMNALSFEVDYEQKLIELREEINSGVYRPGRSIAFIVNHPVKREIFAADFRDRVVDRVVNLRKQWLYLLVIMTKSIR